MTTVDKFGKVIITVVQMPGLSQADIMKKLEMERSCVCRLVNSGIALGFIKKKDRGHFPGEVFTRQWRQN